MDTVIQKRINIILSSLDEKEKEDYLKDMIKKTEEKEDADSKELLEALNKALLELEVNNESTKDEEVLETLQKSNSDFYRLSLVKTTKFENDSNLDINYLYYKNELDKVEMLEIKDERALINFIKANKDNNYTAKDIFKYFKNHVSREVEFKKIDDKKEELREQEQEEVLDDDVIKDIEIKKVNQYKKENQLHERIEQTIDSNGERLYKIGTVVLKFETIAGKRELKVLETGKNMEEEQEQEVVSLKKTEEVHEQEEKVEEETEELEETESDDYDDTNDVVLTEAEKLKYLTDNYKYETTYEEFAGMVERVIVNQEECDIETHARIIVFMRNLKSSLNSEEYDEEYEKKQQYYDYFMNSIEPLYIAYKNGEEVSYDFSEEEIAMIDAYVEERKRAKDKQRVRTNEEEKSAA